jgi:hypothetical protein
MNAVLDRLEAAAVAQPVVFNDSSGAETYRSSHESS